MVVTNKITTPTEMATSPSTPESKRVREDIESDSESDAESVNERDQVKMKELEYTNRGFSYVQFEDHYGQRCSIQQSSVYTHVWLGVEKNFKGEDVNIRMHLSMEQVQALLPYLERFAKTGSIEPDGE